jgi:hypothetical protein
MYCSRWFIKRRTLLFTYQIEVSHQVPCGGSEKTIYLVICALLPFLHSTYVEHGRCTLGIVAGAEMAGKGSYTWLL